MDAPPAEALAALHITTATTLAELSTQVLESPEHLESILGALWPDSWAALPLLSRTTNRLCQALGHRCADRCGLSVPRGFAPLRTLASTAHVYLFGGVEEPDMARHCFMLEFDKGKIAHEPLPPMPEAAHAEEISATAAGDCIYVTADVDHELGCGQHWAGHGAGRMAEKRAYIARFDLRSGTWSRVPPPPPPDATHASPVSGCLGCWRGALVHTGGRCSPLLDPLAGAIEPLPGSLESPLGEANALSALRHTLGSSNRAHRWVDGRWEPRPTMCLARLNHSLCEHKGHLYAAGGCPLSTPPEQRYERAVERFDGQRWERLADVPLCAPFEREDTPFSLQLVVCGGDLHAILIGFDEAQLPEVQLPEAQLPRPFALFRWQDDGGGWTRCQLGYPACGPSQPSVALLGSPVVAYGRRILIFGRTMRSEGACSRQKCVYGLLREGDVTDDGCYRWLPIQQGRRGSRTPCHTLYAKESLTQDGDENFCGPSEWTAGVALPVSLT